MNFLELRCFSYLDNKVVSDLPLDSSEADPILFVAAANVSDGPDEELGQVVIVGVDVKCLLTSTWRRVRISV